MALDHLTEREQHVPLTFSFKKKSFPIEYVFEFSSRELPVCCSQRRSSGIVKQR